MTEPKAEAAKGEMPFLDHLEELRWRLVKSIAAIGIGVVGAYGFVINVDVIGFLKRPLDTVLGAGKPLLFLSPMAPFMLALKLALIIGLLVALPVVVYQMWCFLRPALYKKEQRVIMPAAIAGTLLFLVGGAAGFFIVLPITLPVLLGFASQSMTPAITVDSYFSLTLAIILAFGAVFELPLVMTVLVYLRILSSAFLRKHRRAFIIINAVASSVLTPGDIIIMTLVVMVPVQLFYELSIILAMILERRRAKEAAAEAAGTGAAEMPATGQA